MVRSSQDDGVVETNYVIRIIGQMSSEVCVQECIRRKMVVIDTAPAYSCFHRQFYLQIDKMVKRQTGFT